MSYSWAVAITVLYLESFLHLCSIATTVVWMQEPQAQKPSLLWWMYQLQQQFSNFLPLRLTLSAMVFMLWPRMPCGFQVTPQNAKLCILGCNTVNEVVHVLELTRSCKEFWGVRVALALWPSKGCSPFGCCDSQFENCWSAVFLLSVRVLSFHFSVWVFAKQCYFPAQIHDNCTGP